MRRVTIFAVGLAAVALAGCGGSSNSAGTTSTTTTTSTVTQSTPSSTTTTQTTTTAATGSGAGAFTSGKCKDLAASSQKIGQDLSAAGASGNLQDVAKEFQAFVQAVPSEIRPDVQTLADAFTAYANALKGIHITAGQTPSAADLQKLQAATKSFDVQKVQAAEKNLTAWTKKNC